MRRGAERPPNGNNPSVWSGDKPDRFLSASLHAQACAAVQAHADRTLASLAFITLSEIKCPPDSVEVIARTIYSRQEQPVRRTEHWSEHTHHGGRESWASPIGGPRSNSGLRMGGQDERIIVTPKRRVNWLRCDSRKFTGFEHLTLFHETGCVVIHGREASAFPRLGSRAPAAWAIFWLRGRISRTDAIRRPDRSCV